MIIRPACVADITEMVAMGRAFHAESPHYGRIPMIDSDAAAFIQELMRMPTACVFVADSDGVLVGMIGGTISPYTFNFSHLYSTDCSFYVRPDRRGGATAVRLIRAYERWAQESGVAPENIMLGVSAGIKADEVHEFLKKMGYSQLGISFRKGV